MRKKLKILILEDIPEDAELIEHELHKEKISFVSFKVDNKQDFFKGIKDFKPDLILSDYSLPRFTGLEALELVKEKAPEIPFIIVTGSLNEETAVECMKKGAWDYVIKEQLTHLGYTVKNALKLKAENDKKKLTEEALQDSEKKFSDIANLLPQIVYESDINGILTFVNKQAFNSFGYSQEEFKKGINALQTLVPEDKDRAKEDTKNILYGKDVGNPEYTALRKDGSTFPILIYSNAILKDNKPIGLRGIIVDITQRKQSEKEINMLAHAIKSIRECVSMTDLEDNLLFVNDAFLKTYGYEKKELIGQPLDIIRSPNNPPELIKEILLQTLQGGWQGELLNKRKDGSEFSVSLSTSVIRDENGRSMALISVSVDLSERKKLEEQLNQAQKMEAIGKLAGGIAHDFNNLLTVINGYSGILLSRLHEADPIRKELEQIKQAGELAGTLTTQLLAFSRQQVIQPRVINLNTQINDIEKMLHRLIGEDIELVTMLDPVLANINADKSQIDQVIMNLAVNARDAMPGIGKLTIKTANFDLNEDYIKNHLPVAQPGRYIMLAISDNGCGIDKATQSKIFDPFFTTKEQGKGTGLGLSTVYGIVKKNGGYIWVYSEPDKGTTFKIYFPCIDKSVQAEKSVKISAKSLHGSEIILIVEDNSIVRKFCRYSLTEYGYKILEAENGEEALAICKEQKVPIHLIITDVIMPRMGGRELEKNISCIYPEIKVLFVSGYTDNAIMHHGVFEEGVAFLEKPFSSVSLLRKVREVLDSSQNHERLLIKSNS